MGAERCLDDGEDAVARDAHPVPEALEVVDHALHRRHDATPGCPRAPDAIEEGLGENEVAGRVRRRGVHQCHVGRQGLQQPERAEGGVDHG